MMYKILKINYSTMIWLMGGFLVPGSSTKRRLLASFVLAVYYLAQPILVVIYPSLAVMSLSIVPLGLIGWLLNKKAVWINGVAQGAYMAYLFHHMVEPLMFSHVVLISAISVINTGAGLLICHFNRALTLKNRILSIHHERLNNLSHLAVDERLANRRKNEFIANLSHELKNPVSGILGISELLSSNEDQQKQKKYYRMLKYSGEQMQTLLNDAMDLTMIESDKIKLVETEFLIAELLEEVCEMYQAQSTALLEISTEMPPGGRFARISTDRLRLKQVLMNLMSNAVKFTPKGFIKLGFEITEDDRYRFYVSDSGKGIPAQMQDHIFDRHKQVSPENSSMGHGLGLAICKKLTEALNGQISLASEPGCGSTFRVCLPEHLNIEAPEAFK